jgi:toxin CptA
VQFPIIIGLHRSRFLDAIFLLLALLAFAVILLSDLPQALQIACLLAIPVMSLASWKNLSPELKLLRLEKDGGISIRLAGENDFQSACLLPGATAHPWLVVFHLNCAGRKFCVVATKGSATAQDLRRLRVFLRWRANFSVLSDDA